MSLTTCNFCGRTRLDERTFIRGNAREAGPVYICFECISICAGMVNQAAEQRERPASGCQGCDE